MTKNNNKISLAERLQALLFNKVRPVLVGYDRGTLSGSDIPIFRCPACGREFTSGSHCRCGVKFDWGNCKM